VLVSPKLDGVRVIILNGVVMSRNLKPIPNARVQRLFGRHRFNGLDGELIVGPATDHDAFRVTTSGVMAKSGEPDVSFYVFDIVQVEKRFSERIRIVQDIAQSNGNDLEWVRHERVSSEFEIDMWEASYLDQGYEGLMIRDPYGEYKFGRSTTREGGLLKLKRFSDSEAVIHDTEEKMHNDNEKTTDALGRAKRQSLKENLRPAGVLGALVVQDVHTGVKFNVGTGFNDNERRQLWTTRKAIIGKVIKYRFFPTGSKEKPRFPTYLGFRDSIDF
jgi:DNA ligase-1